jgi:replicative DNA helicase
MRVLCAEAGVSFASVRAGRATSADWTDLLHATEALTSIPLWIADASAIGLAEIRAVSRGLRDIGFVAVDYLQLMSGSGNNRQEQIAGISRGLKLLARDLDVPVVACSQLNRDPDRRQDKRPTLSDLRESGALEQDADLVLMLHRGSEDPEADLIVAKHRNGPTGQIKLTFLRDSMRFADHAGIYAGV